VKKAQLLKQIPTWILQLGGIILMVGFVGLILKFSSDRLGPGCPAHPQDHKVVIQNDQVFPEHTSAPRCDTLTITNLDDENRLIAFGPHENHVPYDGVAERLLSSGEGFTVRLNQTGNFRFHDHIHDEVQGTFTVTD